MWIEPSGGNLRAFDEAEQARWVGGGWLIEPEDGAGWKLGPEAGATAQGAKPATPGTIFDDVDNDGVEDEPIPVNGWRPRSMDDDSSWGIPSGEPDNGPSGAVGGPSGGGASNQQKEDADDTPCVDQVPAGADLDEINDLAKFMGTKLGGFQDATGWEWGAFIYRAANGQLYQSDPFTAQHHDDLIGASIHLPPGAHIVGYIHTHPINDEADQRMLSEEDRDFINDLVGRTGSVTADTNLLAYVTTKDKDLGYSDAYSTFVYDKSNRDAVTKGCDL